MAGERLAGTLLSQYLKQFGKQAAAGAGKYVGTAAEEAATKAATPFIRNINIADAAKAPGMKGRVAGFVNSIDPSFVGGVTGKVAEAGTGAGTALIFDVLSSMGQHPVQTPSKQQVDSRQQAAYNAMFTQQMQATQGMQPAYAPSPMQQFTPQGRLISEQGNNRVVQQYYYNPSDPLTAAAKIYASMPKMSFPSVL
jgi:hypothetical protein